jgi:hypothetical protein
MVDTYNIDAHPRSGMYGLVAQPKVGSNLFAIGLRYSFQVSMR